jgi:hypothetical protein
LPGFLLGKITGIKAIKKIPYQGLYIYGFVETKTGKNLWYLIPRVNHHQHFETIKDMGKMLITRCQYLERMTNEIKS